MNKILSALLFILFIPTVSLAVANPVSVNVVLTNNNAIANGTDIIKVKLVPCGVDEEGGSEAFIIGDWTLTGSGTTVSNQKYIGFPEGGLEKVACGAAYITWDVKATTAGTKNMKAIVGNFMDLNYTKNFTVVFTDTTTTENNNTTSTPTSTSTTQTQEKEEAKKPETPVLNKLRVGENELTGEKMREENQFRYEEGVKFSGTTIPNGIVHLYFNSDPYETTVTADKDGNWSYTLDKDLGEGEHTLEIAVEDPETEEVSEKSDTYSFTLVAGETTSEPSTEVAQEETENTSYPTYFWFLIGGIVVVLVGSGIGGWYYFKKKKGSKKEPEPRLKNQ